MEGAEGRGLGRTWKEEKKGRKKGHFILIQNVHKICGDIFASLNFRSSSKVIDNELAARPKSVRWPPAVVLALGSYQ